MKTVRVPDGLSKCDFGVVPAEPSSWGDPRGYPERGSAYKTNGKPYIFGYKGRLFSDSVCIKAYKTNEIST